MDVFGLIGNPVGHSVSPPMHEAAYERLGVDARYVTFEPSEDALERAIEGADALGIDGLNVTIPFKERAANAVVPDPLADRIGAVNTIDFDGEPTGYNTDAAGLVRAFEHRDVSLSGSAVVVGAGGAGRAAAFALAEEGVSVHVANRTVERAESLAGELPGATAGGLPELGERLAGADLLVNATSVGMDADETPVPKAALHPDLAVLDAVYTPPETRLLREARSVGATAIEGVWMLLFQGVEAFEIWTGRAAPVDAMRDALEAAL
ncbi:shikimate dehydrogenase [Natronomonas sp.]|uniref:shikimate dehydrogenase n=1 Tax=Natronomonas sp. TaxID=2184060 RepID=UPI002631C3BB|nr:shikimate dehydrogenase [Natronomonas sp.]